MNRAILCSSAELAVSVASAADPMQETRVAPRALEEAIADIDAVAGVAMTAVPAAREARLLADRARERGRVLAVFALEADALARARLAELGLVAVSDLTTLVTAARLATFAFAGLSASLKALSQLERTLLGPTGVERTRAAFTRDERGALALELDDERVVLGRLDDVVRARACLRATRREARPSMPRVEDVDRQAVLDVVLGPERSLSDPASKAALEPYDLPLPVEELCTSASRAAAEATRIGFPVRLSLASPDLRPTDHPDLTVEDVEGAARVKEIYRQLHALALARVPTARILGVSVGRTTPAHALLHARAHVLDEGVVEVVFGFADPHGRASHDATCLLLPARAEDVERAVDRLRGVAWLMDGRAGSRREVLSAIGDFVLRLGAFVHDFRDEVLEVRVPSLALLLGGGLEIREACVDVSGVFERSLAAR